MLLYKWGWKNLKRRLLNNILSFIIIAATFTFAGIFVSVVTYNPLELEKERFFSTEVDYAGRFAENKYMMFCYGRAGALTGYADMPKDEYKELVEEISALGLGYSINYSYKSTSDSIYFDYNINEKNDSWIGLYDVEKYIAKEDAKNSLYNEEGEIAPYFSILRDKDTLAYEILYKNCTAFYNMDDASLEAYGYTLYGKFPETKNEIAIPYYLYNSFKTYGYKNGDGGEKIEINSPEDMIGKELLLGTGSNKSTISATVVGVLDINQDLGVYLSIANLSEEKISEGYIHSEQGAAPILGIYVSEEYLSKYIYTSSGGLSKSALLFTLKSAPTEIQDAYFEIGTRALKNMTYWEIRNGTENYIYCVSGNAANASAYLWNGGFGLYFGNNDGGLAILSVLAVPIGAILAAFLLTLGLFQNKKQFAVLRRLGARKQNIFWAYFIPVAVLLVVASAVGVLGDIVGSHFMAIYCYGELAAVNHISVPYSLITWQSICTIVVASVMALVITGLVLFACIMLMGFKKTLTERDVFDRIVAFFAQKFKKSPTK